MIVMMIATTPSLNASSRPLPILRPLRKAAACSVPAASARCRPTGEHAAPMRRPLAILAIAVAASAGLLSVAPSRVAADDQTGVTQTAATVVRLDPANGRLRVSITLRVTNHTPDGV